MEYIPGGKAKAFLYSLSFFFFLLGVGGTFVINPPYINLDFISTHQYMEIKDKI